MRHPLQDQIAALGRRARRLMLLHGLSSALFWVLLAAGTAGVADYFLRPHDRGLRVVVSLAVLAVFTWSCWRFVWPPWAHRLQLLDVALRIESQFPQLRDRLSSTLVFLDQAPDDPTAGSAELRRAVVTQTAADVERLNLFQCLDSRGTYRRAGLALAAGSAVALAFWFYNGSALLAARRLLVPWSGEEWPRRNVLAFVQSPRRLSRGQSFEFKVVDRSGRPPDTVSLEWSATGPTGETFRTETMQSVNSTFVYRMDDIARSFKYRAWGGDDNTMNWIEVQLVEPPAIDFFKMVLYPPAYSGWPSQEIRGDSIRALEGTHIEFGAQVTKPVQAVQLRSANSDVSPEVQTFLSESGEVFTVAPNSDRPWRVEQSGLYWFELTDQRGLPGGKDTRWEIQALPDLPPTVSWNDSDADPFATPTAVLGVTATAKDDLALQKIELRFTRSDRPAEGEQVVELFRGPDIGSPEFQAGKAEAQGGSAKGESRSVSYEWDLSRLEELQPGARIELRVAASDYKPNLGVSISRQIAVISTEELEKQISRRQVAILAQLAEALRVQQVVRSQTDALRDRLNAAPKLELPEIERLQGAEITQRQVAQLLGNSPAGAEGKIQMLLRVLATNRVTRSEIIRRMDPIAQIVKQLNRDELPLIQRELATALKDARADRPRSRDSSEDGQGDQRPLIVAVEHQRRVISRLEELLGELSQWDSYRRFADEISRLRMDQESLRTETQQRQADTLSKDLHELTDAERTKLQQLARRQHELARRFDRIQGQMQHLESDLRTTDPDAAAAMADSLAAAATNAIGQTMRESGGRIERNQVGQAAASQQDASRGLDEMFAALSRPSKGEAGTASDQLTAAIERLAQLAERQASIHERTCALDERLARSGERTASNLAAITDLAVEQRQLAADTGAENGPLASEAAFAFVIASAVEAMNHSGAQLERQATGSETQRAQVDAMSRLSQLLDALRPDAGVASDRNGAEANSPTGQNAGPNAGPPPEELWKLAQLKLLRALQQGINQRTQELDAVTLRGGALTPEQVAEVELLSREQEKLAEIVFELMQADP